MKHYQILLKSISTILSFIIILSCKENLPVIEDFSKEKFILINQNNQKIEFPTQFKGKILVVSYIFTNCTDICPCTINNMRLIQERLEQEKINNVEFITISFDPTQDSPAVLKNFAELRELNLSNWEFVTGDKSTIDSLIKKANIYIIEDDSAASDKQEKIYYIHTDRVQLFDKTGKVRKNYKGSEINIEEIVSDIKHL